MSDFFQSFINNFLNFFNWEVLSTTLSDPVSWGIIGTLVILEGLLSADNALVLAVMVKHLPKEQQKKALFYGLLGAYIFRFIAIGVGTFLVQITWIKVLGGAYLLWIAISNLFFKKKEEEGEVQNKGLSFWRTVLAVEVMDIAFSVDSVLAAFGVSDQVWVLFLGGIIGVLMMRGVAQVFLKLIDKIPELEKAAFILIIIIGLKMIAGAFGVHISHVLFFSTLIVIFGGTIVLSLLRKKDKQESAN
ncbi:TerC family protein [Paenibacillus alginolyticus]|uniref:TerC family protein n=1 Tax=Paenibacillus alginolyticus TaxID=59839 RepID=A0ABT4G6M8_9BACL|nr:TerC family protein [Paenibacillus alginolyticus]MCY9668921.1 TerC family protein [Paenibacillus alginolyticus]MCY9691835.1 TerC family protein [Paenibacillus alginolyticus]MEC0143201.1 TerC family protein [Paenibacillus alginolyticus]